MSHNRTNEFNLAPDGEGRQGLWFDYNGDAKTDIAVVEDGYVHLWKNTPTAATKFTKVTGTVGMVCSPVKYAQLADLDADGRPELICVGKSGEYPSKIYRTGTVPFQDVTNILPFTAAATDSAVADFDNNGRIDVFMMIGKMRVSEVKQISNTNIEAYLDGGASGAGAPPGGFERGFSSY